MAKFIPGGPRPPGSGRAKGTPNKQTQELIELAERLGVNPFEVMLNIVKNDWQALGYDSPTVTRATLEGVVEVERITVELRAQCAQNACSYLYPKRKAIEHSGPDGGPIESAPALTDAERLALVQSIREGR